MSAAVLLGAGASADAGIPMTLEMIGEVIDPVPDLRQRRLLEFIRLTLGANLGPHDHPKGRRGSCEVVFEQDLVLQGLDDRFDALRDRPDGWAGPFGFVASAGAQQGWLEPCQCVRAFGCGRT